jgi:hypothetical protein
MLDFAVEIQMANLPDPYRVAYESALVEVTEIAAKFEQLRLRKSQLETLAAALQSVFAAEAGGAETGSTSPAATQQAAPGQGSASKLVNEAETAAGEGQAGFSYLDVPNPLPENDGDPFQRRVKTAFRFKGLATQRS